MGSRSRFKPKLTVPGRRACVRCHQPIDNQFRKQPWCLDCGLELQQMSFNGEEVLDMVASMMPPTPPHPDATIKAYTVLRLSREVLISEGLLLRDDDNPDDMPGAMKKPNLILS